MGVAGEWAWAWSVVGGRRRSEYPPLGDITRSQNPGCRHTPPRPIFVSGDGVGVSMRRERAWDVGVVGVVGVGGSCTIFSVVFV